MSYSDAPMPVALPSEPPSTDVVRGLLSELKRASSGSTIPQIRERYGFDSYTTDGDFYGMDRLQLKDVLKSLKPLMQGRYQKLWHAGQEAHPSATKFTQTDADAAANGELFATPASSPTERDRAAAAARASHGSSSRSRSASFSSHFSQSDHSPDISPTSGVSAGFVSHSQSSASASLQSNGVAAMRSPSNNAQLLASISPPPCSPPSHLSSEPSASASASSTHHPHNTRSSRKRGLSPSRKAVTPLRLPPAHRLPKSDSASASTMSVSAVRPPPLERVDDPFSHAYGKNSISSVTVHPPTIKSESAGEPSLQVHVPTSGSCQESPASKNTSPQASPSMFSNAMSPSNAEAMQALMRALPHAHPLYAQQHQYQAARDGTPRNAKKSPLHSTVSPGLSSLLSPYHHLQTAAAVAAAYQQNQRMAQAMTAAAAAAAASSAAQAATSSVSTTARQLSSPATSTHASAFKGFGGSSSGKVSDATYPPRMGALTSPKDAALGPKLVENGDSQTSRWASAIQSHMKLHGEPPLRCTRPGCSRAFFVKSSLEMHLRSAHGVASAAARDSDHHRGGHMSDSDSEMEEPDRYQTVDGVEIRMMPPPKRGPKPKVSYNEVLPYIGKLIKLQEQGHKPTKEFAVRELIKYLRETNHPNAHNVSPLYLVKKFCKFAQVRLRRPPKGSVAAAKGALLGVPNGVHSAVADATEDMSDVPDSPTHEAFDSDMEDVHDSEAVTFPASRSSSFSKESARAAEGAFPRSASAPNSGARHEVRPPSRSASASPGTARSPTSATSSEIARAAHPPLAPAPTAAARMSEQRLHAPASASGPM